MHIPLCVRGVAWTFPAVGGNWCKWSGNGPGGSDWLIPLDGDRFGNQARATMCALCMAFPITKAPVLRCRIGPNSGTGPVDALCVWELDLDSASSRLVVLGPCSGLAALFLQHKQTRNRHLILDPSNDSLRVRLSHYEGVG